LFPSFEVIATFPLSIASKMLSGFVMLHILKELLINFDAEGNLTVFAVV
jgi:hypothetical protein